MPLDKSRPKTPKRVMEKKRRARINDSLVELKNIVLQATNRNDPRHSKLEKADILEMTVKYLRNVPVKGRAPVTSSPSQYRSGYAECMREVRAFLDNADASPDVSLRLLDHLSRSCRVPPSSTPSVEAGAARRQSNSKIFQQPCVIQSLTPILPSDSVRIPLCQATSTHSTTTSGHLTTAGTVQSSSSTATRTPPASSPPPKPINIQFPVLSMTHMQTSHPPPPVPLSSPRPIPHQAPSILPSFSQLPSPKGEQNSADMTASSPSARRNCQVTASRVTNGSTAIRIVQTDTSHLTGVIRMSRTQEGDLAVVLPQSTLPGGKLPTHLIPVFDHPGTPNDMSSHDENVPHKAVASADRVGDSMTATTAVLSHPSIPPRGTMTAPPAAVVAPLAWCARPALLATNVEQVSPVFATGQASVPVTITLPIQARIVQNLIPVHTATISPILEGPINHIPVRLANPPNEQGSEEDEFMWRPW